MELPSSDLLYPRSIQLCRGLAKLAKGELGKAGLSPAHPVISEEGEPCATSLLQKKYISKRFCLFYTLAWRREIAPGSADKLTVIFFFQ